MVHRTKCNSIEARHAGVSYQILENARLPIKKTGVDAVYIRDDLL
jgi:hypothetical protein